MQPTKIALQNFLSYGNTEVDLNGLSLVALLGMNGAGKSSLVDGLTFPLYGEGRYKDIDKYIRQGQENATAELQFILAGATYRIIRTRSNKGKGKSTLELAKLNGADFTSISGTTIKETQDKIKDLLRMDYDTFVSSCVLLQGEADRFSQAGSSERMRIFSQIIGLDVYGQLLEAARAKAKDYRDKSAAKRAVIDNLDYELTDLPRHKERETELTKEQKETTGKLKTIEKALDENEKAVSDLKVKAGRGEDLRNRQKQVEHDIESSEGQLKELEHKQGRLQQIISNAKEIRENADKLDKAKTKLSDYDNRAVKERELALECEKLEKQVSTYDREQERKVDSIKANIEASNQQAELLNDVPCSGSDKESCKLLASARKAAQELPAFKNQLDEANKAVNPYAEKWQEAVKARDGVGYAPGKHQELRQQVNTLEKWAKALPELEQAEVNIKEIAEQEKQLSARAGDLKKELTTITADLGAIAQVIADLRSKEAELFGTRQQFKEVQDFSQEAAVQLGTLQAKIKDLEEKAEQKKAVEAEIKDLITEETIYTQLAKAYKEIPVLIMENALPDVEELANGLLGNLTGGRIAIRFETQREAKTTGNVSDTLDIIVTDELGERPYEGWSGAERFDVDLSIRLAISKFLAKRAGTKIEVLIIDEGCSALDDEGRQRFVEAINAIAEEFKLVICITHINELKEAFPQQLVVSKTPEGSRVEVVA